MACTKERASLINEFAVGKLPPEKAEELLDHLRTCEACSVALDAVAGILTCQEQYGAEVYEGEPSSLAKVWSRTREALRKIFTTRPLIRVAIPAAVTVVVALFLFNLFGHRPGEYAQLAQFETPRYIPRSLRGPGEDETIQSLFEQGMDAYANGDFERAARRLSGLTKVHPEFGEAFFYLGISHLMMEKNERAIDALQRTAVLLKGYPLEEQSHWYLGMAFLKQNDKGKALQEFQQVVSLNGVYRENAERMIGRVKGVGD